MALGDLTLQRMEYYGAIDLKRNYKKYLTGSLGISIGLHVLLILFYFLWVELTTKGEKNISMVHVRTIVDILPPPSNDKVEATPVAPPSPSEVIAKPNFGMPVLVPDAIAPTAVMSDITNLPAATTNKDGNIGVIIGGVGDDSAKVDIQPQRVKEADPDRDVITSVESDPEPTVNIQSLVVYPEVAKRAGLEGKVVVSALIGKDGRVEKVEIDKSDYKVFEDAAIDAVMKTRFTPALQNKQPVRVWYTVPISFKLNNK